MNLSIFSSEHLIALRHFFVPHRYRLYITVFASLLTVTLCSLGLQTIGYIPASRLDNIALDKVTVLILGNSQLNGLLADDERMLNLALGGSDYTIQFRILRNVAPRLKNLRFVMLGFDNIPLRTPAIARMKGDYRSLAQSGIPWYDIPEISPTEKLTHLLLNNRWTRPFISGPKLDGEHILSSLRGEPVDAHDPEPVRPVNPGADVVREGFYLAPAQGQKKISDYLSALNEGNSLTPNLLALQNITDYCRTENLGLILLRPPTTGEFIAGRSQQWNDELAGLLSDLRARHPRHPLPFWDANEDEIYGLEYFDDPNHLSAEGKRRYSGFLMSKLEPVLHNN